MSVWIYRADGSLQCGFAEGESLETARADLAKAVGDDKILSQEKRQKPGVVSSVCGAPTGAVNAYELSDEGYQLWLTGFAGRLGFEIWIWGGAKSGGGPNNYFAAGPEVPFPMKEPGIPFPMKALAEDLVATPSSGSALDLEKLRALIAEVGSPSSRPHLLSEVVGHPIRVIAPGDAPTLDLRWDRINFYVDGDGKVTRIAFH